ncbi:MAG TPA: efflux RND transporter periplasmic adaptor subunit [Blastocatellia bacterium]|jgi:RND family efflux transporter MFP subunit|nr:efflux RND transporter periplasmic adaptor subunit [Blastocatellia bacterium]
MVEHTGRGRILAAEPLATNVIPRILIAILLAAFTLAAASCYRGASGKQSDSFSPKPVSARVVEAERRQVRRNVESVGSLYPYEEVTVSSEVEGKVEQVLVDVGDHVAAGQPIVKVVPTELQLTLDQQRASLRQARARLGLAEDGEDLKDVTLAAEVKKAAADLNDAQQKYNRAKSLYEQGLVPRQNFDEAEARYNAARAAYDLSVQAIENLRAQLVQSRASTALAQKKVSDSIIRAPFAGEIKERNVTQGQYLKVQTPVMVIVNADPLRVRLKVPEKMAAWVRTGQVVTVAVEAYPDRSFSGKISRINPSVEQQTRSYEVEALIENHERLLKPGFFVKASIPSSNVVDAVFVPRGALLYVYGMYKVFTVQGDTLKEREVKIGERADESVEVMEGLSVGERVAIPIAGQELKDGARIEVVN